MKYNKLKNLLQGITTATIYSAYIPDNIPGLAKVIGIISELSALNKEDIRFGESDLTVYGKGAKERTVYLNETSSMYLREYLASRTDNNPALFVSVKAPHKRLSKAGIEYVIRTLGKRAMVEKAHPHRFRRTALTNAMNRGMPLQEAMIMAGHSKPETTMRYCNVDQEGVKYHHKKYLSA